MLLSVYFSILSHPCCCVVFVCVPIILPPHRSSQATEIFCRESYHIRDIERFQFPPFIPATCQAADLVQWLQWPQRPQVEMCRDQQIHDTDNVCMPLILGILHGTRLHHAAFFAISPLNFFLLLSQETIYDRQVKLSLFGFCFIQRIFPGDPMEW